MAQEIEVTLIVQTQEAVDELEAFAEQLNRTEKKIQTSGNNASKGYKELANVFTRLLPRSMQGLIRNFNQTQRSVNRASKSVKLFNKAWIATGFGAAVVVLGELVANWDSISEAIGLTNKEMEAEIVLQNKITQQTEKFSQSSQPYVDILKSTTSSINQRVTATDELVKLMPELNGLDLTSEQGMTALNSALEENVRLTEIRVRQQTLEDQLRDAGEEARSTELSFWQKTKNILLSDWTNAKELQYISENQAEGQEKYNKILEEYNLLIAEIAEIEGGRAETKRLAKEDEITERNTENKQLARLKIEKELLRAEELLKIEKSDTSNIELQLAAKKLEFQQKDQIASMELQGASNKQVKRQRVLHQDAMTQLYTDFLNGELEDYNKYATALQEEIERNDEAVSKSRTSLLRGEGSTGASSEEMEMQSIFDKYQKQLDLEKEFSQEYYAVYDARERELARITDKYADERTEAREKENKDGLNAALDFTGGVADMYGTLSDLSEENEERSKQYAVTEVALNSAVALANAIAGAAAAAKDKGAAAPFVLGAYIISMFSTIMNAQKQISTIMNQVGAGGGDDVAIPQPVVPNVSDDFMLNEFTGQGDRSFRAYVVESDIQGAMNNASLIDSRASLGG